MNVAWYFPGEFSRVLSHIGSFTGIQWAPEKGQEGGYIVSHRVRREARKNLRVWMSDGADDIENQAGSWPLNNIELANALKPVVLPGEIMKVFILKEGKEYNQGVAYLDDGTMVVIDNARRLIGRNLDVIVTSVLQTTAGRMIFGRYADPAAAAEPRSTAGPRPVAQA